MLNNLIKSLTPDYGKLRLTRVFLILCIVALMVRFPFFFRDYVDRDESTFILVAQSWVNGHLPFTELWDVKPPLTFLFFASIISVFGKSIFAVRFFGTLLVVISSFFTYRITAGLTSKKVAFWAAIFSVFLQSSFGSLQGVMSEHITMAFFMPALYLLTKKHTFFTVFCTGLLLGVSVMVKLNMAYAILFIGLYLIYSYVREKKYVDGFLHTSAYGFGILLIIGLTILPYYFQGISDLWWKSVVQAPLEYANARRYSIFKMAPLILVLTVFFLVAWKKKYIDFKNIVVQLLLVSIIGVVLSFVKGGRVNGHYLIQLHPILIVLVAIVLGQLSFIQKVDYKKIAFLVLILLPVEAYLEYGNIIKNKWERGTFYNGEGISVPAYIKNNKLDTSHILFLEYHIGYWVLGVNPPTKAATHPSNICKDEMFKFYDNPRKTSMEELKYILEELRPKTIVGRSNRSIFDLDLVQENAYINTYLEKHYEILTTVEKADIYQRLEGL
ncbi:ArnT family glycosyltransferase [Costertonia aggregata]|uniref:Glycosyltransferase family 39 protein n=1 Tax=Costertonia aggregata TaxID=343403 RepID=A0A7H9AQ83_9FLAO|nr:glycosyltransferase family 39 protein [Costertonia aggregata]QLG45600.1 glycosyltransferase family 39 protein [Costertonia aggregata]